MERGKPRSGRDGAGESSSLLAPVAELSPTRKVSRWYLFGLHNRSAWMWITVGCLFIGRAVTPLASESLDAATTALIEDPTLNITAADLASLSSAGAVCGALGKILAGPAIGIMNGRNAWLMLLSVGSVCMLCVANVGSMGELFMIWMAYTPFAAMAFPATTVIVAGWVRPPAPSPPPPPRTQSCSRARAHAHAHEQNFHHRPKPHPHQVDGHLLGRVLGALTFAAKGAPSLVDVTAMGVLAEDEPLPQENVPTVSEPESL